MSTVSALALTTLIASCGGRTPVPRGAAPATLAAGPLPQGPREPVRGLPMPSLDVAWMPPILTAGDLGQLRDAIKRHPSVALHLGDRLDGTEWQARARALVQALHPETSVTVRPLESNPLAGVSLSMERIDQGDERPRYRWSSGPLPAAPDASATLVVDDATLEPSTWRALPASVVGGCQAPMQALAAGQEQSLAELEPFLDHADGVLWQVYRAALSATVPRLEAELEPYRAARTRAEFSSGADWEQHRCGHAYWDYLQEFSRCGAEADSCPSAPRMFLIGGARIGTSEPSTYIPRGCAAKVGRDYVARLRTVAAEAAEVAHEHLAPSWSALADRLGAVTEVYEALEDVCVPRRRRFSDEDLLAVRNRLVSIGQSLSSDELAHPAGRWTRADAQFHVPGFGPVQQVAYYDPGPGSPSQTAVAEARMLRELVLRRSLCRSAQPSMPLVAALVEGSSGRVESFGYFFEEELFCGELPPLVEDGAASACDDHARCEPPEPPRALPPG